MKLVKPLTPFLSAFTCAAVSRTTAVGGRTGLISLISFALETPDFA
jgi:hypothetical protein